MDLEFPILIKKQDAKYCIGVDICSVDRERNKFTFCIMEETENKKVPKIVAMKWFYFTKEEEAKKNVENYLASLKEFYNCPILIESK